MTDILTLLSWSRRGAGALPAHETRPDGRRLVAPPLKLGGYQGPESLHGELPTAGVTVHGPADCEGISPLQIVRRSPVPGDMRQEPNYLALVEFSHPDIPWLFSGDTNKDRPDPWLMLVVVRDRKQGRVVRGRRGPVLRVSDPTALSRPAEAWAFAHVQVATAQPDAVDVVKGDPQSSLVRSRIICPTKLAPNTAYLAALVPTFELGRLAGLGFDIPASEHDPFWKPGGQGAGVAAKKNAYAFWKAEGGLDLPAYDHWTFTTGAAGDFESLARKLRKAPSAHGLGQRRVAVEARASLMQDKPETAEHPSELFAPGVETVPTAIAKMDKSGRLPLGPFAPDQKALSDRAKGLQERLKTLVELVAQASGEEPIVGPPLYGQWPADTTSLDLGATDGWVTQLNADPYQRIAAGIGARIVAHDQESLMTDAWRQLAALDEANRRIRFTSLMATAMQTLHDKLAVSPPEVQLRLTSNSFGRIPGLADGTTVHAEVQTTTLPSEALGPSMVRIAAVARRAAIASSSVSVLADAAASPIRMSTAVVNAFVDGSPAVIPRRFTHALTFDLDAVKDILGSAAFVDVGQSLVEKITALEDIPVISAKIAARFDEPQEADVLPVGQDVAIRVSPKVSERMKKSPWVQKIRPELFNLAQVGKELDDAAVIKDGLKLNPGLLKGAGLFKGAGVFKEKIAPDLLKNVGHKGGDKIGDAVIGKHAKVFEAGLKVGDFVAPQPDLEEPHAELMISAIDLVVLRKAGLAAAAGAEINPADLSLQSDEVRLTLGSALRVAPDTALDAMIADHSTASAIGVAEAMRTSVLAEVGFTRVSPLTKLGQLSATDVVAYQAAADARAVNRSAAQTLPSFAAFDGGPTDKVVAALAPDRAYPELLSYAHTIASDDVVRLGRSFFQPLRAAPTFNTPLVKRLAVVDKEWLLGGVSTLPPNSVSLFGINTRFVEALLAGANHEMMRELVWRGYPTNLRGTCFRRFWDLPRPDIKAMTRWTSLGANHAGETDPSNLTVVVIKGDLLRRYPNTIVSAVRGKPAGDDFEGTEVAVELDHGHVDHDVTYSILDVAPGRLFENGPKGARWYISLLENTHEARFGLDDQSRDSAKSNAGKADFADWSWQGLPNSSLTQLTATDLRNAETSAQVGSRLCQQPFRALLPATDYIAL